jgi:hypothetical protein
MIRVKLKRRNDDWNELETVRRELADGVDRAQFHWLRALCLWCLRETERHQKEITDKLRRRAP